MRYKEIAQQYPYAAYVMWNYYPDSISSGEEGDFLICGWGWNDFRGYFNDIRQIVEDSLSEEFIKHLRIRSSEISRWQVIEEHTHKNAQEIVALNSKLAEQRYSDFILFKAEKYIDFLTNPDEDVFLNRVEVSEEILDVQKKQPYRNSIKIKLLYLAA